MPRKKKEPEPVELEAPQKTRMVKTKEFVKDNKTTLWRTFQTAALGFLIWGVNSAPAYIDKYMENQKKQAERQAGWQARAEARFQILSKNDTLIMDQNKLILKHFKIKQK